jgi:non-homologous end joining protein Ku
MGTVRKNVAVSFGLLTASVNVLSAIAPKPKNVTVCTGAGGKPAHAPARIRQQTQCPECGPIEYHEIKKAREVPDGLVLLTDEDRADLAVANDEFKLAVKMTPHPVEAVDLNTAPGEKAYYLECVPGHEQSFTVLKHLIESHPDLAFMLKYTPRTSMGVYRVLAKDDALLMQERIAGDKYTEAPGMNPIEVPEALLGMGEQVLMLPGVIVDFDLDAYRDSTEDKIAAIIASRTPETAMASADGTTKATPRSAVNALSALEEMLANAVPAKAPAKKRAPAKKKAS